METWKQIPGYERIYEVSDQGRVKRTILRGYMWVGRLLKPAMCCNGYLRVHLYKNGERKYYRIHRLVLAVFVRPCPDGMETNHKDGVKTNNYLNNLEYTSPSKNVLHAFAMGLREASGEANGRSKITEDDVREIRRLRTAGMLLREVAELFELSRGQVGKICNRKSWKHA